MCGIAGYLDHDNPRLLSAMAARITHRGPDGHGIWTNTEERVGLAHRRLAIIDLSDAAAQPMVGCDGRYVVVFNGEIYNFRHLGAELQARGYAFNGNSDTAILAPLYDLHGPKMLTHLNGIFAFAIWDRRERKLFVARDALGVKPLYYAHVGRGLVFASELKALLALDQLDRSIDLQAICAYMVNLWSPGERTPLSSVSKLPPGHMIEATLDRMEVQKWHRDQAPIENVTASKIPVGERAERLRQLFDKCVSDQCISDVPIGAFLSGGVDSSAIVASMVATGHSPKNTYCIGFNGPGMTDEGFGNDLDFARAVAASLNVPIMPIMVEAPTAQAIVDLVYILDEPQADPAPLYVAAIAEAAKADGIKVLMSGTGGDDVFSGYRRHRSAALRVQLGGSISRTLRNLVPAIAALTPGPLSRRLAKLSYMLEGDDETFLLRSFEFNPRPEAIQCLAPHLQMVAAMGCAAGWLEKEVQRSGHRPLLERMLELERYGFLPDHNLNYTDKASMAHGVEVRVPFLDARLIAMARDIPWQLKTRGFSEKWLLKQAMANRLPSRVLTRKKTGFGGPVRQWISGPMRAMIDDIAASQKMRERGLFNTISVRSLIDDTLAGRRDGAYLVLAIIMIELWMRQFVDMEGSRRVRD